MIKINLLEVERERRPRAPTGEPPTTLMAVVILGVSVGAFVFYYFAKQNQISTLQEDVREKQLRKKELEPYIKRVEELDKRRSDLAKRNHAIEQLRSQRTIPVHILDEVSRALPEYLWLTNLIMRAEVLSIDGQTLQEQAIPTFMKALDASEFIGTCRLIETRQIRSGGGTATAFRISAPVTNPFKPKPPAPAQPKRGN